MKMGIGIKPESVISVVIGDILADESVKTKLKFDHNADESLAEQMQFLAEYGFARGYILTCVHNHVAVFTHKSVFLQLDGMK